MSKFTFNGPDDVVQMPEVAIMQTSPARQLPNALDRIQFRAVGGEVVKRKAIGMLIPPRAVKARMVVFRVVSNDGHPSSASAAGRPQVPEKVPAGHGVELIRLAPKEKLAVAQPDRPEIADAAPRGVVKQDRILGLRRHPHPAARTVLLEMHFVHGPKVNRRVET